MKINYFNFEGFENIFLEDSFVLDIKITPLILLIDVEIVLTSNHILYQKPLPNEFHCYRKAQISFSNVKSIKWTDKIKSPNKDLSGEVDFGNIDEFFLADEIYKIFGELGDIEIVSDSPKLEIY
jgi:hypothetical protein